MNPVHKMLDEVKYTIPMILLQETFKDNSNWRSAPVSIDERIMNLIIRPRIMVDADLVGGMMIIIPLDGLQPEYIDNYSLIYKIPDDRVLNRTIISVLSIGYMPYSNGFNSMGTSYGNIAPTSINDTASVNQRLADSYSSIPPISNAVVDLIGHNTVVIRDQFRVSAAYQLRAIVGNETNLNNLNPRSYHSFAKLCTLGVKSYIYNELIIRMDKGFLLGGQELGSFKNIVDGYADAEEQYQQYLHETYKSVAFMNDVQAFDRFLKLQICPGL